MLKVLHFDIAFATTVLMAVDIRRILILPFINDTFTVDIETATIINSHSELGGRSAMLYDRLLPLLEHGHIILAEETETAHLANVQGDLNLWHLYEALELL